MTGNPPLEAARAASLRYVTDAAPGISRRRAGRSFRYFHASGKPIHDPAVLRRIRTLAVPPAWRNVWICPMPSGHIQAVGRDAKGRKQYRYHIRWREVRDDTKYGRMLCFGQALPLLRARVERDLALPGLPRAKVLATVVRLLDITFIRVGNNEYARANGSFGLTTLRNRHVRVAGAALRFQFRSKRGKEISVQVDDRRVARIVKRCQELPGHELFQCLDDVGRCQAIDSANVNAYVREITRQDFTAKDFRTWAGTLLAMSALQKGVAQDGRTPAKRGVVRAIRWAADRLANTPAICRKCYVHPAVIEAYLDGSLRQGPAGPGRGPVSQTHWLSPDEKALLSFLRQLPAKRTPERPFRAAMKRRRCS